MLAVFVFGAWFSVDLGQGVVLGQDSLEANAALLYRNPCRVIPLRYQNQFERVDYTIVDGCNNPIPGPIDFCPNIAGIQNSVPAGYQLSNGQCVVIPPSANAPTCTLSMSPSVVTFGNGAILSWTTTNATALSISGVGLVTPLASGSLSISPAVTTTYLGTVNGASGSATCTATLTILADALNNGGIEQQGAGATTAYDWQAYGNGYARVQVPHSGAWSLQLSNSGVGQTSGAYQRLDLNQTSAKPVFIGGYVKGNGIATAPGSSIGASIYAEIYFTDGSVAYWNTVPNSGTFNWRWIGFNTATLATQKPISHIFIIPILGSASGNAYFDDIIVTPIQVQQKSAVTIMFDDGELNTFTEAKPILDAYNFKGVAVIPVGDLGSFPENMTSVQVQQLQASGWEIVSHAINNDTNLLTDITSAQAAADIANSKTLLQALGLTIRNFAWPFGAYNAELIGYAQASGYTSTRTFESGNNPQGAFPYDIKVRQVKDVTTPAQVAEWIAEGKANNRWEVIVFHTIGTSADVTYSTSKAVFAQMISAIATSGVPVVTYNQGLVSFATVGGPYPVSPITPPVIQPPEPIEPINPCGGRFGGRLTCYIQ